MTTRSAAAPAGRAKGPSGASQAARITGVVGVAILFTAPLTWVLTDGVGLATGLKVGVACCMLVVGWMFGRSDGRPFVSALSVDLWIMTIGSTVLAFMLLLAANIAAWRRPMEWDGTGGQIHTLAAQTQRVVRGLGEEVRVLAFFRNDEPEYGRIAARLQRYSVLSPRFAYQMLDPRLHPDLADTYRIREKGSRLVVLSGTREARLEKGTEQAVTNAIVRVTSLEGRSIHFLVGHGEGSLDSRDADGFQMMAEALRDEGYELVPLRLFDTTEASAKRLEVPQEASVVVMLASRGSLLEGEVTALEAFLNRGGAWVVLTEPRVAVGIEGVLRQWKIDLRDDIIADSISQQLGLGWAGPIIQPAHRAHAVTDTLVSPAMMTSVRSLALLEGGEAGVAVQALFETGRSAWSEGEVPIKGTPRPDQEELKGPLTVAAVAARSADDHDELYVGASAGVGRLVVFGDSDWLSNQLFGQQGNASVWLNTINWLAGEQDRIAIRPRTRAATQMTLTPKQLGFIKLLSMDIIPITLVVVGASVVMRRRQRRAHEHTADDEGVAA